MHPSELREWLLRHRSSHDVPVALRARAARCPTDETLAGFAQNSTSAAEIDRLLPHLRECPRCLNLALLLTDDAPVPQWAVEATREATIRWRQALPDATVHICPFRALNTRLIGIAAAPPDRGEAQIVLTRDYERYTVEVRRGEEPQEGAEVVLAPAGGGEPRRCRTNASGAAEFADLPAGRYRLQIEGCEEPLRVENG